jgi:hypothetical protein
MRYIIKRLKEYSTWYAVILVLSTFVFHFTPDQQQALMALASALALTPDKQHRDETDR